MQYKYRDKEERIKRKKYKRWGVAYYISLSTLFFFLILPKTYALEYRESRLPVANYGKGPTLLDVERFLKHPNYFEDNDPITSTHEQIHGVCSLLRQKYRGDTILYIPHIGSFSITIRTTTIAKIAPIIPTNLRGSSYNLYLIQQQRDWNNQPGYLLEEWVCYYAGALTRAELRITQRRETVKQMLDFMVYSLYMYKNTGEKTEELEKFLVDQIYRCADAYHKNLKVGDISDSTRYLEMVRQDKIYETMLYLLDKYPR